MLQPRFSQNAFTKAHNKEADQTARMHRCSVPLLFESNKVPFLAKRPIYECRIQKHVIGYSQVSKK